MQRAAIVAVPSQSADLCLRPLRGVPLILWSVRALSAVAPLDAIAILNPASDGRFEPLARRHSLGMVATLPDGPALIADPLRPFASPDAVHTAGASGATHARLADHQRSPIEILTASDEAWPLLEAVARGLPPDHSVIAGVGRFRLPARLDLHAIVTDVDGCLTDGGISYFEGQHAGRTFNTHDGYAHHLLAKAGIKVGWLSATSSAASIERRAAQLRVPEVDAGEGDKGDRFVRLCARLGVDPSRTLYLGDDLNDLPAMKLAGATACPADAASEVRATVDLILDTPGGRGAFREAAEILLALPNHSPYTRS